MSNIWIPAKACVQLDWVAYKNDGLRKYTATELIKIYCFKIEMKKALLKYQHKDHLVIPIIVRETPSWHKYEIGQLKALPKDAKPLDDWKNSDRFWGDVQRGLERELESLLVKLNSE